MAFLDAFNLELGVAGRSNPMRSIDNSRDHDNIAAIMMLLAVTLIDMETLD